LPTTKNSTQIEIKARKKLKFRYKNQIRKHIWSKIQVEDRI